MKRSSTDSVSDSGSDHEDSKLYSAQDILDQVRAAELEAAELYPGKFDACTYEKGYITQPLYVCVTCHVAAGRELYQKDNAIVSNYFEMDTLVLPQTALFQPESLTHFKPFVVCYPCSIACHGAHDLIELFNRREFRCDCGNQTYCASATSDSSPLVACTLCPRKDPLNERNPYRNRKGEWDQNLLGLFCSCSVTYPPSETRQMFQCLHCQDWFHDSCMGELPDPASFDTYVCSECYEILQKGLDDSTKPHALLPRTVYSVNEAGHLFLHKSWRSQLCTCPDCTLFLSEHHFHYLLPSYKEVIYTPEPDLERHESVESMADKALEKMPRVAALEGLYAIETLKNELKTFLKPFALNGMPVTKDDILMFFEQVNDKKRMKWNAQQLNEQDGSEESQA